MELKEVIVCIRSEVKRNILLILNGIESSSFTPVSALISCKSSG